MESEVIQNAITYIKDFFKNDSSGHDYFHSLRVVKLATKIAEIEHANVFVVQLAALLHDVDDRKITNTNESLANARNFMKSQGLKQTTIDLVCTIIHQVSFKGSDSVKPTSLEGQIVQDADRLEAIGAIGIARAFAYGGSKGRPMYDPSIAPTLDMNESQYTNSKSHTINHFYEKLLLLKDQMNTKEAQKIATSRHEFMEQFLKQFYLEWDDVQ